MKTILRLALSIFILALASQANVAAAVPPPSAEKTQAALEKLQSAGIITAADLAYWKQSAVSGKTCDKAKVAALIKSAAAKLGAKENPSLDDAIKILKSKKVITVTTTWQNLEKPDAPKPAGSTVAILISGISTALK